MRNQKDYSYFLIYAIIGFIAVLGGFGYTYIVPMAKSEFQAPIGVHVHGAFSMAWILLYLFQNLLINKKNYKLHMTMGLVSIIILVGFFISLFPAMAFAIERDLPQDGDSVYGSNMVALTSGLWVLGLGIAGLYYRKRSQVHKRLMFLATIVILWPAWGRWRHYFPDTIDDNWFMLYLPFSFIIWAWIWEKRVYGKIHPILLIIGILIIAEGFLSSLYIGSEYCTALIKKLYSLHI